MAMMKEKSNVGLTYTSSHGNEILSVNKGFSRVLAHRNTNSLIHRNEELVTLITRLRRENADLKRELHDINYKYFIAKFIRNDKSTQTEILLDSTTEDSIESNYHNPNPNHDDHHHDHHHFISTMDSMSSTLENMNITEQGKENHSTLEEFPMLSTEWNEKNENLNDDENDKDLLLCPISTSFMTPPRMKSKAVTDIYGEKKIKETKISDLASIQESSQSIVDENINPSPLESLPSTQKSTQTRSPAQERVEKALGERCISGGTSLFKSHRERRAPLSYSEPSLRVKVRKGFEFFKFNK